MTRIEENHSEQTNTEAVPKSTRIFGEQSNLSITVELEDVLSGVLAEAPVKSVSQTLGAAESPPCREGLPP